MTFVMKLLPGLAGAAAAYIALKVLGFMRLGSIEVEIIGYFAVYVAITIIADKAMTAYGRHEQ